MSGVYFDDLQVAFVGHFYALRNGEFRKRDLLRVGLMTGKEAVKVTRQGEYTAKCPLLFFNFANEEYLWRYCGQTTRESYFFDISGPRAERIQEMLRNDFPNGFTDCRDPIPFRMILDNMNESFHHHRAQRPYRLPMFVEQFLTQIYVDHTVAINANKYESAIRNTADDLYRQPGGNIDFDAKAKNLGITPAHYRRLFKAMLGLPPLQYRQKCRLEYVIELLKRSKELQIQQISDMCGFNNPSEFSRFFKKKTGFSPAEYCQKFSGE